MEFTFEEINLIRQWFNAVEDISPEYLEKRDHELGRRIEEYVKRIDAAGQGALEP